MEAERKEGLAGRTGSGEWVNLRKWCVEQAINWAKEDAGRMQTDQMIDCAALIERYVTTGKSSQMMEVGLLMSAMQEAEQCTPGVGRSKAKAVCDAVLQRCGVRPNAVRSTTEAAHE